MSYLSTDKLSIGYAEDKILIKDISISLNEGEFIGLIGQNGVGKSTFIRTLCGLQKPIKGSVLLDKKPISNYNATEIAKRISVVLTGKPETLNLSVIDLITLGRFPYSNWLGKLNKEDKDQVEKAISLMEINYIASKKLFELSDGQLQKVMIARALAQDTEIIILDEPTSHLDLRNKIEVLRLLQRISETGKAILISTHEIQLTAQVCNDFWCMDFNQPILKGKPDELIKSGKLHEWLHLPSDLSL
ncbi:MAG: ABC transporter ATP-binding protein [Ekhidna sp.]